MRRGRSDNAKLIPLERVKLSKKNRKALKRDSGQIELLRRRYESGCDDVPITVIELEDEWYQLVDGRHRYLAAELAGEGYIEAIVTQSR